MNPQQHTVLSQSPFMRRRLSTAIVTQYLLLLGLPTMSLNTVDFAQFATVEAGALVTAAVGHWLLWRAREIRVVLAGSHLELYGLLGAPRVVERTQVVGVGVARQRRTDDSWLPVLVLAGDGLVVVTGFSRIGELAGRQVAEELTSALGLTAPVVTLSPLPDLMTLVAAPTRSAVPATPEAA